jgi:PAS domain S-box-containing protein
MDVQVHVLLIEDNPHSAFFIEEMLATAPKVTAQFKVVSAARLSDGLALLSQRGFDVVLLDLSLPDSQGLETFDRVHTRLPEVPIIVLSGFEDEALAIQTLAKGAQDYLVKGQVNGSLLARAIRYAIERVRAEEALRESERRFRALVEQAADAFFVFSSQGSVIDVNRRACVSLGYTRDELLNLTLPDIEEDLEPSSVAELWRQLPPGRPITLDAVHRRKDGATFPVESRIGLFESGGRQLMVALVRDVTERKWAEEALRRYTAELEARNQELDAFVLTVAHDLKCPLGYIVGFAHVLEEDYQDLPEGELRRYLRTIAQSGHKMGNIIDELLVLAGVGKMEEVPVQSLDMRSVITEALDRLDLMVEEYEAEIVLPDRWPMVQGYAPWLEEVWVNYLSNALKYGGEPPRVELGATKENGGMIRFWVKDNGVGLTTEEQARLFIPFERLDPIRTQGHGLGLSIVRRIVERQGGQVGVESQLSRGSIFSFTLPVPV